MTISLSSVISANHSSSSPTPFSPKTSTTTEDKTLDSSPQQNLINRGPRIHLETKSSSSSSTMALTSPSQVTMPPSSITQVKLQRLLDERIPFARNSYKVDPLSELVLFGAKGSRVLKQKGIEFGRTNPLLHLNNRLEYALSFLRKVEAKGDSGWLCRDSQIDDLQHICSSRLLQFRYAQRGVETRKQGEDYTKAIDILNGFFFQFTSQREFHEEAKVPVEKAIQPILKHIDQEKRNPADYKDAINLIEKVIADMRPSDSRGQELTTVEEKVDQITSRLTAEGKECKRNYIRELIDNIHLLDDPTSHKVIALKDQTTMFAIPGGTDHHYVSYEFRRELKSGKENYVFVVHDRSIARSAVAKSMNGDRGIVWKEKSYGKTSLTITTSKSALINPRFIEILLSREEHVPYAEIHLLLVELGKGEIVQSDIESLWDRLYVYNEIKGGVDKFFTFTSLSDKTQQKQVITRSMLALARWGKYMNCEQLLPTPTCNEGNMQHEIRIIDDDRVQDGLQLHTIQQHIEPHLQQRLDAIKNTPASGTVCKITTLTGPICVTKDKYQKDAELVLEQTNLKKERLLAKLAGTATSKDRMEQSIETARSLLAILDACNRPDFVSSKEAAQNKIITSRANEKKYLVEHNQNMRRYLALVPDEWRCDADFMLRVIAPHPEHTNPWSDNLRYWFMAWAKALHPVLSDSEDTMLKAVAINPMALQAASARLKDNESFITRICEMHTTSDVLKQITPWALIHASRRIRSMPKYIAKLPILPTNKAAESCLMYLIPEDISQSWIFQKKLRNLRKFNKPTFSSIR